MEEGLGTALGGRPVDIQLRSRRVGGYWLEEQIGGKEGRKVYKAHSVEGDEAIVTLLSGKANSADERAFLREATAAAATPHPFVVEIREIGYTPAGAYWACEPIDGELLADRLLASRWGIKQRLLFFFRLCAVVEAISHRGILLNRLTADDVFVQSEDVPKIFRFRQARFLWDPEMLSKLTESSIPDLSIDRGHSVRVLGSLLQVLMMNMPANGIVRRLTRFAREAQAGEILHIKDLMIGVRQSSRFDNDNRRGFRWRAACL